jgi:cyclophilin family peptidyl-prolyl cis-trans isomerase/HEAT repeat protein
MKIHAHPRFLLVALLGLVACRPADAGRPDFQARAVLRILAAEDARPAGGAALDLLVRGTASPASTIRALSVRALGRLENPALSGTIAAGLTDEDEVVRREAANALAQAVHRGSGAAALPALLRAAGSEHDPSVLGVVARSLGRLRLSGGDKVDAARALVALSRGAHGDAPPYQMEGVALGMASYVRSLRGDAPPGFLRARLQEMTTYGRDAPAGDLGAARVRAAVVGAYAAGGLTAAEIEGFLADPATEVRRHAADRLAGVAPEVRIPLIDRAMADPSAQVRIEAVRQGLAALAPTTDACTRLLDTAAGDADTQVRLAALAELSAPCPDRGAQISALLALATSMTEGVSEWHVPGQALVSLSVLAPAQAGPLVRGSVGHANPFARMWVANAALRTGDIETLKALAADASPNVQTAALGALADLQGREADPLLIESMATGSDNQLLLTLAGRLAGTEMANQATAVALEALERVSEPRWETLRDARMALLTLVEGTGDSAFVYRVEPYIRDYDPAVALRAAEVLRTWTGKRWIDAPRGSPRLALPTPEEFRAMEDAVLVLHMARGGTVEIRLFPWLAPTNAVRFYHLAGSGALDGLTFHRVVPNFVIQGGSPGANEYAGYGAYTRDEVGLLPNWRGTVGLSTRGRDTGDGQMYLNLVDDLRLDHDYTVYGAVVSGMDVVDAVLEGDVIQRVDVRPGS